MSSQLMRTVELPGGETIAALGQGTWRLGENAAKRREEIAALQLGIDLGMTLIDTAEMYGDGATEELVGEAIRGRRDEVFIVSKVLPTNASRRGVISACDRSLKRMSIESIDLYLLHWPGSHPLVDTIAAFNELADAGKIRHWGVSNFDLRAMQNAAQIQTTAPLATNQVLYNLSRRGIEFDLLSYCERHRMPIMAYSPIEQGRILRNRVIKTLAEERGVSAAQIALAWVLRQKNIIAIPRARNADHVRENRAALALQLNAKELEALDKAFPPPTAHQALDTL